MKNFKNIISLIFLMCVIVSCTKNDDDIDQVEGTGKIKLEFDQVFKDADFIQNTSYTLSNGETIKINKIKFIISNVKLKTFDGTVYSVPKSESYFIVDEFTPESRILTISNIPAGNYTEISFGIGVDKEQFDLGASGQGNFLTVAQNQGMMWSWSAGYKFLAFEGVFSSVNQVNEVDFKVHTGQTGTDYNYTTVSLNLPDNALVRKNIIPQIHLMTDLSKILDGENKISLQEQASIMGGVKLALITANISQMFKVHHVHND